MLSFLLNTATSMPSLTTVRALGGLYSKRILPGFLISSLFFYRIGLGFRLCKIGFKVPEFGP